MAVFFRVSFAFIFAFALFADNASAQRPGKPGRNGEQTVQGGPREGKPQRGPRQNVQNQNGQGQGTQNQGAQGQSGAGLDAQQVAQRMMANFDADGNGSLDMQELTNGLTALEQAMRQRQGGQQRQGGPRRGEQDATSQVDGQGPQNARRGKGRSGRGRGPGGGNQ